ncbi:MAG TPA: sigma-54 dependent transcriptional regulator [bacterium]|nr:sigma-54 dependent transcriptional regulator [bacterium]
MAQERILVVDDEEGLRRLLSILLTKEGYDVTTASSAPQALEKFEKEVFDAVITDIKMPGMSGIELLKAIRASDSQVPVIVMTAYAALDTAIEAVNQGAFHYFVKQTRNEEIKLVVRRALEMQALRRENRFLRHEMKKTLKARKIVGQSSRLQEVFDTVRKVAKSDSTVLLCGESGTGKELFAREIHNESKRAGGPFTSINCGALPESLLESELFGHVKGSFTGAIRDKEGLFTVARAGSFLLDEVGETSLAIQVKLLRVLQEREIIPVGGQKPLKVDVRVIAATNKDLEREVERGAFRADLFYRLNVIPITLPPLRERREDIPLLVQHFLKSCCGAAGRRLMDVDDATMRALVEYHWPGNVRELENVIERGVILEEGEALTPDSIPDRVLEGSPREMASGGGPGAPGSGSVAGTLEDVERAYLVEVLEATGWHKKKASTILGINSSTLYRKIQRYGLAPEEAVADDE